MVSTKKRWPTNVDVGTDYLSVYLVPAALLLLGLLGLFAGLSGNYFIFMIITTISSIPLGIYLHRRVKNANYFFTLDLPPDAKKLIPSAMKQIRWTVIEETDRYIVATSSATLFSWGEINTIVFTESEILFNSKPSMQSITLYASEKVNSRRLTRAIKEIEKKLVHEVHNADKRVS